MNLIYVFIHFTIKPYSTWPSRNFNSPKLRKFWKGCCTKSFWSLFLFLSKLSQVKYEHWLFTDFWCLIFLSVVGLIYTNLMLSEFKIPLEFLNLRKTSLSTRELTKIEIKFDLNKWNISSWTFKSIWAMRSSNVFLFNINPIKFIDIEFSPTSIPKSTLAL